LFDGDEQPAAVVGEVDVWASLRDRGPRRRLAVGIFRVRVLKVRVFCSRVCRRGLFIFVICAGRGIEFVVEDVAVIHFLAGGDVSFFWVARVVEAGIVVLPGDAGGAGAFNRIGQEFAS